MNIVTQAHLTHTGLGSILTQIALGISTWCSISSTPSMRIQTSVVVTDDVELANEAKETNDVVILISCQPETVCEGVIVCTVNEITEKIRDRLSLIEHQHSH